MPIDDPLPRPPDLLPSKPKGRRSLVSWPTTTRRRR